MADPATWMVIATAVSAGGQYYSGQQAMKAADKQSELEREQGRLAKLEADREANRLSAEGKQFRDRQILAYLKSGVTLQGSPLLILEDTIQKSEEEAEATRARGRAQYTLYSGQADITKATGRAQYIAGITGAVGTVGSNYATGRAAGIYGSNTTTNKALAGTTTRSSLFTGTK